MADVAAERDREGELEVLDVRLVDRVSSGEIALRAEVVMVHQPVLRLGIEQALVGHVGGARRAVPARSQDANADTMAPDAVELRAVLSCFILASHWCACDCCNNDYQDDDCYDEDGIRTQKGKSKTIRRENQWADC